MRIIVLAAAAALLSSAATAQIIAPDQQPQAAAPAPVKAKPKPKPPGLSIVVANKRAVPLTAIGFQPTGGEGGASNLLKTPLAPGKSITLRIAAKKGQCAFDVLGGFADESELASPGIDLCKEKTIRLVD